MLRTTISLLALLAAAPAAAEGPAHDPRLERVAWEMAETERSPRVLGWSAERVDENTIVLSESWPEGYRVELTTEGPIGSSAFFASDNVSNRMTATLHHPGQDSPCTVGWGRNPQRERVQMALMPMGEGQVAGHGTLEIACYGSPRPLVIALSIVPGV